MISDNLKAKIVDAYDAVLAARELAQAERHKRPIESDANEAFQCLAAAFDAIEDLQAL
jgi:hypothetical protein